MPQSSQGITARWLLFTAALSTFTHLSQADDNFGDFDWLNETQLLEMLNENITEWNSTEAEVNEEDVDASFEGLNDGETIDETIDESVDETGIETVGKTLDKTVDKIVDKIIDETVDKKSKGHRNIEFPFEDLHQHRYYARIVYMVILLHVAIVGVCLTIYSLVYCKMRTLKKLQRTKALRSRRLMNLQTRHVPNSRECPCSGCIVARDMLQNLVLQQMHELVEC